MEILGQFWKRFQRISGVYRIRSEPSTLVGAMAHSATRFLNFPCSEAEICFSNSEAVSNSSNWTA